MRPTARSPSPAPREGGTKLIRVHRLSSLCAGRTRFFALTPSPSPTAWERGAARSVFGVLKRQLQHQAETALPHSIITAWARGVGAHGGAPYCAFPLARPAGEGDKGGEGKYPLQNLPVPADNRTRTELPGVRRDVPGIDGELPSVRGDVPGVDGELPSVRGDVPAHNWELPGVRRDVRSVSGELIRWRGRLG